LGVVLGVVWDARVQLLIWTFWCSDKAQYM
jgi:hypothetical protein